MTEINKILLVGIMILGIGMIIGPVYANNPFGAGRLMNWLDQAEAMGLNYGRFDLFWSEIQPEPGTWDWSSFDARIASYESNGLTIVPNILCGEFWGTGDYNVESQLPSHLPADFHSEWDETYGCSESYYTFVYNLVSRYIDHLTRLVIENEVSVGRFWDSSEQDYVRLLKTAYKAAHDANPDIMVYDSGLPSYLYGTCLINDLILDSTYTPGQILHFANGFFYRMGQQFPDYDTLVEWINDRQDKIDFLEYCLYTMRDNVDGLNIHFAEDYWYLPKIFDWLDYMSDEYGISYNKYITNELAERELPPDGWPYEEYTFAYSIYKKMIVALSMNMKEILYFPFSSKNLKHEKYGLLNDDRTWTEAAYSYHWLISKIGDEYKFQEQIIHPSLGDVRVYLFASKIDSSALYFLWWDDGFHGTGSQKLRVRMDEDVSLVKEYDYLGNATIKFKPRPIEYFNITESPVCLEAWKPIFHFEVVKN